MDVEDVRDVGCVSSVSEHCDLRSGARDDGSDVLHDLSFSTVQTCSNFVRRMSVIANSPRGCWMWRNIFAADVADHVVFQESRSQNICSEDSCPVSCRCCLCKLKCQDAECTGLAADNRRLLLRLPAACVVPLTIFVGSVHDAAHETVESV